MQEGEERATEEQLLRERAGPAWLQGDVARAVAAIDQVDRGRYRVRGLDRDGLEPSFVDRAMDTFDDVGDPEVFAAVRGRRPDCAAVGLYRAARYDHAWLAITPSRVGVLRLRDVQNVAERIADEVTAQVKQERSVGGLLRGVGKVMTSSTAELAKSIRRPPLVERPQDAVLECVFEVTYGQLHSVTRWKPPLMPSFSGGPRHVQVQFDDESWARLETDTAGAAALTGPEDG